MSWAADKWIFLGAVMGGLGVAVGAFGAHGLPGVLEALRVPQDEAARLVETFRTGVLYHLVHAPAIVLVGILARDRSSTLLAAAGWCFLLGIVLFSGLLYALALTGPKWLGAIVPAGGLSMIAGWLALSGSVWSN